MEKMKLEELINKGYSQRQIAEELECSQGNIKYWLKKYEIKELAPHTVSLGSVSLILAIFATLLTLLAYAIDNKRDLARSKEL